MVYATRALDPVDRKTIANRLLDPIVPWSDRTHTFRSELDIKNHSSEKHIGVRSHAVTGDKSNGLKSRLGNCSFTPVVKRSIAGVILLCKFRETKRQAATKVNLYEGT